VVGWGKETMLAIEMPTDMTRNHVSRLTSAAYNRLETLARQTLEQNCPYAFYFRFIRFLARNGVLTIRGSLPSFYLKQILISHLQRIDGVDRIDDQIDVVSSNGLSSVRH
jgi:hypothetical protein